MAVNETLSVDFMDGYFQEQIKPDYDHDPKRWWEVINRTTQEVVPVSQWRVDMEHNKVIIENAELFNEYTCLLYTSRCV